MKKLLLLSAALVSVAAMAQDLTVKNDMTRQLVGITTKSMAEGAVLQSADEVINKAPQSVTNGVYYRRPEGCLYSGYTFGEGMAALHLPALENITYVNACTSKPSTAVWTIGEDDGTRYADADNNLVISWPNASDPDYDYSPFYGPTITQGRNSFTLAAVNMTTRAINPMLRWNPTVSKNYSGFTDGPAYGTNSVLEEAVTSQTGAVVESYILTFEKPISPLYIETIDVPFWSESLNPIADGVELTLSIYRVDEEGKMAEEPEEVLTAGNTRIGDDAEEYQGNLYGDLYFAKIETGVFGEELETPITIDYRFNVVISGHHQDGVNVNFRMTDLGDDDYEFYTMPEKSACTYLHSRNADGTYDNYYWSGTSQNGENYSYCMPIIFYALYDKVEVSETVYTNDGAEHHGANVLRVSADGQTISNEGFAGLDRWLMMENALPFIATDIETGEELGENYEFVDCPDWITVYIDDQEWAEYATTYLTVECEPLPEGVTGRAAYIYVQGKGVTSAAPIVVLQGDAENGIESIAADHKAAVVYNLAGQRADNVKKAIRVAKGAKEIRL